MDGCTDGWMDRQTDRQTDVCFMSVSVSWWAHLVPVCLILTPHYLHFSADILLILSILPAYFTLTLRQGFLRMGS